MARQDSDADQRLSLELQSRSRIVSARQVARWREAKILRYERRYLGRGKGSTSTYGAEVVELACALADCLAVRRSLRDAVLALHGRGYPIDPDVVRRALLAYLDSVERALRRAVSAGADRTTARSALESSKEGRAMLRRLEDAGLDERAFVGVARGLLGESEVWVSDLVTATGLGEIAASLLDKDTMATLDRVLGRFTLPELREVVVTCSTDDLQRGLEDSRVVLPFVASFTELLGRFKATDDLPLLRSADRVEGELSVVHWSLIAVWARRQGLDLDEGARLANQYGAGLASLLGLVRTFSLARGPLFGPDSESELSRLHSYEKDSVMGRIESWIRDHPNETAAIQQLTASGDAEVADVGRAP